MASDPVGVLRAALTAALAGRVERVAVGFQDVYERTAPRDTGNLASALRTTVAAAGDVAVLHGEVDETVAPYGKWIDQPPPVIVPVRAKALRWLSKETGQATFAQQVTPSTVHQGWWSSFVEDAVTEVIRG